MTGLLRINVSNDSVFKSLDLNRSLACYKCSCVSRCLQAANTSVHV